MSLAIATLSNGWRTNDENDATPAQWGKVIRVKESVPQWQVQCIKDLLSIQQLPEDWDSYGSEPPQEAAVNTAIDLVKGIDLEDFQAPQVSPVSGGSVQLDWVFGRHSIEIEVLPDGTIEYLKTHEGEPVDEGAIDPLDLTVVRSLCNWLLSG